jgi:phosphate transport system substrate-binding protein
MSRTHIRLLAAALAVGLGVCLAVPQPTLAAPAHAQIEGSGSSWSANAVNQWIGDVNSQSGLQVVFTSSGSAQGRKDFAYRTVDYAVTDIAYQGKDPITGEQDTAQGRPYAYLPIVAGGTSFPYQIRVGGKLVDNLRLSGGTLAKIFTNQITNWADPAITADNNGRKLPPLTITPVVHSEGSGSTAQFSAYLAKQYPGIWGPFNGNHPVMTEYFPRKGRAIAQNGSDGVMNFLSSGAANGAIGYDEYSYALNKGYPVAKLENAAGYFTKPDQYNVAVALTQAVIDRNPNSPTYLIQTLDKVYVYNDVRTYPLSSYSYMVLPTGTDAQDSKLTTPKRQTITDFLYYSICVGQQEMGNIGYSPLPVNLVSAGFEQVQKLKQADSGVDITRRDVKSCNNPTFIAGHPERNHLAEIAPKPPACDKVGAGPCGGTGGISNGNNNSSTGGGPGTGGKSTGPSAGAKVDPDTGLVIGIGSAADSAAVSAANEQAASRGGLTGILAPLAVLELAVALIGPVWLNQRLARRRRLSQQQDRSNS